MTVAEACRDLVAWLPVVAELVAEPDTTASTETRSAPGSKPPWNPAAAAAFYDIHAAARRIENQFRFAVTGSTSQRGGSNASTFAAIDAITKLAEAVDSADAEVATRELTRLLTRILQLPAIDLEDRPVRITAPCPYCRRPMLRLYPREGRVTCIAYGACTDLDGNHPQGLMHIGAATGEPYVAWADGTTQQGELT